MTKYLRCVEEDCDFTKPVPNHCGKQMHVEKFEEEDQLVCWMGSECGLQKIPEHHGKQMIVYEE